MKVKSESEVTESCLTLSDPMDYSPPGSSIHGIFQARVLEWGAIAFSSKRDYVAQFRVSTGVSVKVQSRVHTNLALGVHVQIQSRLLLIVLNYVSCCKT